MGGSQVAQSWKSLKFQPYPQLLVTGYKNSIHLFCYPAIPSSLFFSARSRRRYRFAKRIIARWWPYPYNIYTRYPPRATLPATSWMAWMGEYMLDRKFLSVRERALLFFDISYVIQTWLLWTEWGELRDGFNKHARTRGILRPPLGRGLILHAPFNPL